MHKLFLRVLAFGVEDKTLLISNIPVLRRKDSSAA
jgi:hypothetical protein